MGLRSRTARGVLAALLLTGTTCSNRPSSGFSVKDGAPFVPPGVTARSAELAKQLEAKWKGRKKDYQPRTKHLRKDGTPKYLNRLFLETSPYLLQHAHNPVNWYPWGEEAFGKAMAEGKPVLLSVGYSTCHWCHVMEEESFEDVEIAQYMNENYVAIKVDREERPDIDAIYMAAVNSITGRGGWPMTVWLTPDRKPFYGGTYFPARDGDRGTRQGFFTMLQRLAGMFHQDPDKVAGQSERIAQQIARHMAPVSGNELPSPDLLEVAVASYSARFDSALGGLTRAPKFPSSLPIRLLLRYHRRTGDKPALEMATLTLEKMAAGGMYDQAAGGFHRYSVDKQWLVPHFEKMLYDNALLAMAYLEGYQVTKNPDFKRIVVEIMRYVERDMTSPAGGFYSATDADSMTPQGHREEGYHFTWVMEEIDALLDAETARIIKVYYGMTARGNFEGRNILNVPKPLPEVAVALKMSPAQLRATIDGANQKLYEARPKRPPPLRDEKILVSWNGLMISAHARAGLILGDPRYSERAAKAADFILTHMREDRRLRRSYMDGRARFNGYLDDYAFFIAGLLDLFEATHDVRWLKEARALDAVLAEHYEDKAGGYFMVSDDHEELLVREKPAYDGAEPTGNSIHAVNLLRLGELTTDDTYRQRAEALFKAFSPTLKRSVTGLSEMLLAVDYWLDTPKELVIVAPESRAQAQPFFEELRKSYQPNCILAVAVEGSDLTAQAAEIPLIEGKIAQKSMATAYVCEKGVCSLPTTDPAVFAKQIAKVVPLRPELKLP